MYAKYNVARVRHYVKALETEQQHDYVGYYYVQRKYKRVNSKAELGRTLSKHDSHLKPLKQFLFSILFYLTQNNIKNL